MAKGGRHRLNNNLNGLNYIMNNVVDELDSRFIPDRGSWKNIAQALDVKDDTEDYAETFNKIDNEELKQKQFGICKDSTDWIKVAMAAICISNCRNWLKAIKTYLDPKYQKLNLYNIGAGPMASERAIELFEIFEDWYQTYRTRLQVTLASEYYTSGDYKKQNLEILKRRFKSVWSEKVEQSIESTAKVDTTLSIEFVTEGTNEVPAKDK